MLNKLKEQLAQARRDKNEVKRNVLTFILGEVSTLDARGETINDDKIYSIIKKTIKLNKESLTHRVSDLLIQENIILNDLLPVYWNRLQIEMFLSNKPEVEEIKNAKSDGQAIGIAMKALKTANAPVENGEVSTYIKKIRG